MGVPAKCRDGTQKLGSGTLGHDGSGARDEGRGTDSWIWRGANDFHKNNGFLFFRFSWSLTPRPSRFAPAFQRNSVNTPVYPYNLLWEISPLQKNPTNGKSPSACRIMPTSSDSSPKRLGP